MSQAPPMNDDARADDTERDDVLNAVSAKWKRLSRQEISALKTSRELAQLSFEDALAKEYRELAGQLSKKALMGKVLDDREYEDTFDELYRYVDLTNEQISLRARGRITPEVWCSWSEGMKSNLALPAFARAWTEIKARSCGFEELRRLEHESFSTDPKEWR